MNSYSRAAKKNTSHKKMRGNRKIVSILYKNHLTNEEDYAKIQQAVGPHEDLLTIVKRSKLQWYGYVYR